MARAELLAPATERRVSCQWSGCDATPDVQLQRFSTRCRSGLSDWELDKARSLLISGARMSEAARPAMKRGIPLRCRHAVRAHAVSTLGNV